MNVEKEDFDDFERENAGSNKLWCEEKLLFWLLRPSIIWKEVTWYSKIFCQSPKFKIGTVWYKQNFYFFLYFANNTWAFFSLVAISFNISKTVGNNILFCQKTLPFLLSGRWNIGARHQVIYEDSKLPSLPFGRHQTWVICISHSLEVRRPKLPENEKQEKELDINNENSFINQKAFFKKMPSSTVSK